MKTKRIIKNNILFIMLVGLALATSFLGLSPDVMANEWASGGAAGSSGGSGTDSGDDCKGRDSTSYYNCYCINRCPRWILVTQSVYKQIKKENRIYGSYSSLPDCASDSHIIIAGNQRYDGSVQIFNQNQGERANPVKEKHVYTAVATGISSVSNTTDWNVGYGNNGHWDDAGFLSWTNEDEARGADGHLLTYSEIIYETMAESGFSEKDLAVICPSMIAPRPVYYSKSNAAGTGASDVSTGIKKDYTSVSTSEINLAVGDTLESMKFSHDIYSSISSTNVAWSIQKTGFLGDVFYTIGSQTNSGADSGKANITRSYTSGGEPEYISTVSPQYKSEYRDIKFKVAGSYEFCEEISVEGRPTTKACVKVNVSGTTGYGSKSHVSNRTTPMAGSSMSDYIATDIYPLKGNKRYVETSVIKLDVGESANMTFSHNIYATKQSNGIGWKVTREVTNTSGSTKDGFSSGDYSISYEPNGNPPHSANSSSPSASGVANINEVSSDIYVANLNSRPYTDGESRYIHRDFYRITFNEPGTYKFCEYVYIKDVLYSYACSTVEVGGDTTDSGDCAKISWFSTSSGVTSVASAVVNNSTGTGWKKEVYAKPRDDIGWLHCYYPGVQDRAYEIVTRYHHTHSVYDSVGSYPNTNVPISSFNRWENKFTVSASGGFSSRGGLGTKTLNFSIGDSNSKSFPDSYDVETKSASKVGKTLTEQIVSGYPTSISVTNNYDHSWTCDPYDCSYDETYDCGTEEEPETCTRRVPETCYYGGCSHGNDYIKSERFNTNNKDEASVKVPYNFINTASILIKDADIYAGEKVSFKEIEVKTSPKYNSKTQGTYATRVDRARVRVVTYSSRYNDNSDEIVGYGSGVDTNLCSAISSRYSYNNCDEVSTRIHTLNNPENDREGAVASGNFNMSTTYDAYDVPAGEYICFVVGVYPYTSGIDTQMNASGDNSWYISQPSCHIVAKRPSFQVWGGGISAIGAITVSAANKGMVHVGGTSMKVPSGIISFGSWVEQESITTGTTTLLATGAATGISSSLVGSGSFEGSSNFCKYRVPLSFANYSYISSICSGAINTTRVGNSGITLSTSAKDALVDYLANSYNGERTVVRDGGSVELNGDDRDFYYTHGEGDLYVNGNTLNAGVTHLVTSDGDVRITGDIQYALAGYSTLSTIPKLIIYAENIIIDCSVSRVDAILIADKDINTCETDDINSPDPARKLTINGAIVASHLLLNRTYGASVGADSGKPAEIINYDTSILLWEKGFAESDNQSGFTSVYQKEIAPRY